MMLLAYIAVVFLAARLAVALFNLVTRPVLKKGIQEDGYKVSVLIPARDEQDKLPFILDDLLRSSYKQLEILVYDDNSRDGTASLVREYAKGEDRVSLIEGIPLPAGWLGKNHACHRLALHTTGDYLLFLDADVRLKPSLIGDSLSFLRRRDLDLLSLFPVQVMRSLGERLTVPLINWVLLSLLPLWLIGLSPRPSLAAANGQFMLFRREAYLKHMPHEKVRDDKVEDIGIIRNMKASGYRCQTLLSDGQVTCRMYRDYLEALNGFSRNVNAFFGNNWMLMAFFGVLVSFGPLFVGLALPLWALGVYLLGAVLLRAVVSYLSRQSILLNILLMPLQLFTFWVIMIRGRYQYLTGKMTWKGRAIR